MEQTNTQQEPQQQPEQPVAPPPTAEQPADQTMQKPKKRSILKIILFIVLFFLLLIILVAVGAYYYLQSQGLTPDKLNPQPLTPKTTIAPRDSSTNTYKNENFKFSMPIDKELEANETSYGFGVSSVELRHANTTEDYAANLQMLVFPKALGMAIGQDFDKSYGLPDNTKQEVKDPSGGAQSFTKVRNRTISGLRAFEFSSSPIPPDPELEAEIGVYIEMKADVLVVTTGESNRDNLEKMLAEFTYPLN